MLFSRDRIFYFYKWKLNLIWVNRFLIWVTVHMLYLGYWQGSRGCVCIPEWRGYGSVGRGAVSGAGRRERRGIGVVAQAQQQRLRGGGAAAVAQQQGRSGGGATSEACICCGVTLVAQRRGHGGVGAGAAAQQPWCVGDGFAAAALRRCRSGGAAVA